MPKKNIVEIVVLRGGLKSVKNLRKKRKKVVEINQKNRHAYFQ